MQAKHKNKTPLHAWEIGEMTSTKWSSKKLSSQNRHDRETTEQTFYNQNSEALIPQFTILKIKNLKKQSIIERKIIALFALKFEKEDIEAFLVEKKLEKDITWEFDFDRPGTVKFSIPDEENKTRSLLSVLKITPTSTETQKVLNNLLDLSDLNEEKTEKPQNDAYHPPVLSSPLDNSDINNEAKSNFNWAPMPYKLT